MWSRVVTASRANSSNCSKPYLLTRNGLCRSDVEFLGCASIRRLNRVLLPGCEVCNRCLFQRGGFPPIYQRPQSCNAHQENAISSLAWHPPSGILLGAREAPKPSRIILLCSDTLQAAPGAPENFPQSHRSISQHSYHFLEGPQTCTFAYSAPRASLTLRSPHCQLASYVTPFVDHTVNSSLLLQASSREIV
jgi:hypothetical protein